MFIKVLVCLECLIVHSLSLPEVRDHALAVLTFGEGDVHPVGDGSVLLLAMLHDALVEGKVFDCPSHPFSKQRK